MRGAESGGSPPISLKHGRRRNAAFDVHDTALPRRTGDEPL
ncbi:hypothetical protein [Sphingomonas mali]|nr:hypothetical protein [Sphingomonas mali]